MTLLNTESIKQFSQKVKVPSSKRSPAKSPILHIGIGGFHRSHQAYTWHKLAQEYPQEYADWTITGVCLLPGDQKLVNDLKEQDNLYTLRMRASSGTEQVEVINSIANVLLAPGDRAEIIARIADVDTKIISFTITEGGYNMDYENHVFRADHPAIQQDLANRDVPQTIFGYLAHGLSIRKATGTTGLTCMSCDNIQENGAILQFALLSFLDLYDQDLKAWVEKNVFFPNSMVDRITPVATEADKAEFESQYGLRDNVLVVSEDYFQWVLEDKGLNGIPPLDLVGVEIVSDVRPYEELKLGILNAGHSLVGFLGEALGYRTIHEAVVDKSIAAFFDQYALHEATPVLTPIAKVDFSAYYQKVKSRFANAMINDSTARIVSGSSDKIPKFILPIVTKQLNTSNPQIDAAVLVIAAWWFYLRNAYRNDGMAEVIDNQKAELLPLFADEASSAVKFIEFKPIFGNLSSSSLVMSKFHTYVDWFDTGFETKGFSNFMQEDARK